MQSGMRAGMGDPHARKLLFRPDAIQYQAGITGTPHDRASRFHAIRCFGAPCLTDGTPPHRFAQPLLIRWQSFPKQPKIPCVFADPTTASGTLLSNSRGLYE